MLPGNCARRWPVVTFPPLARRYSEITADQLLVLCADRGNTRAWDEFLRRFNPVVSTAVRRTVRRYTSANAELCEDLAQQVYLKLNAHDARLLREFVPTHKDAAFGYIKVMTTNVVHDYFKGKGWSPCEQIPEDLQGAEQNDDYILFREIDDFLRRKVRPIDRQIFWFHYRHGMTAREIADTPAVQLSVKGVESVLKRVKDLVCEAFSPEERKALPEIVSEGRKEVL